MFAAVWRAYRDEILFGLTMLASSAFAAAGVVRSNTWLELLVPLALACAPFVVFARLRRFIPSALGIVAAVLVVLVAGELVYRARYFGMDAVIRFRSYSPVPVTWIPGFLQVAPDPELEYTFTPGAQTVANGDAWSINAQGFRDDAVPTEKPPGTFRILVTGDSFVMGAFVAKEDRFTDQLETLLNEKWAERFEVINLGLPGGRLREAAHLIEREAVRTDADLVLATLRAAQIDERLPPPSERPRITAEDLMPPSMSWPRAYSFLLNIHRPAVRAVVGRVTSLLGRFGPADGGEGEEPPEPVATYPELLERTARFSAQHGVPAAIVALRKMEFATDESLRAAMARAVLGDPTNKANHERAGELARAAGLEFIDTYDAFPDDARRSDLIVFPGDDHPKAIGHAAYARAIADWIESRAEVLGLTPR